MATQTYDAILFRQRDDAPLQVAFAAPSYEIDNWARVPTKKTGNIRNFQRAEIATHIKEVAQFFLNKLNSSPTSVVVGFDPIRSGNSVITRDSSGAVLDAKSIKGGQAARGTIEISWLDDADPQSSEELRKAISAKAETFRGVVFKELRDITPLTENALSEIAKDFEAIVLKKEEPPPETVPETESGDDSASDELAPAIEIEIPDELRAKLGGLSPSEQQVVAGRLQFLAQLSPSSLEDRPQEYLENLHREVRDELKPGILIDGQHRVMGTKKIGRVPFLVTALPAAEWPELAFQFIVTNRTARRVPESLLISIVGNSLSKQQRAQIEERLRQANIRVGLIEAVMRVHEDEQSPFYGFLAFGLKNEDGFIDAAAMRGKVIKLWYEREEPVRTLFDHFCKGKTRTEKTEFWKAEELWFKNFIAFWSAVRERYEGTSVFSDELIDKNKKIPASRLMTATVLMIFQDTILRYLESFLVNKANTEGVHIAVSLPSEDKFSELVKNTLSKLTPEFFTGWELTGFDGSKGARDDLAEAISKVIKGEQTVAQLKNPKKPHRLFRESST